MIDVDKTLLSQAQPTFFQITNDPEFRPGAAAKLPQKVVASNTSLMPDYCDLRAVVYRGAYQEPLLKGNWLSRSLWIYLWRKERTPIYNFHLMRALEASGLPFAGIDFEPLQITTLDNAKTSYDFFVTHSDWTIQDFTKHFKPCVDRLQREDLAIIHHTLTASLTVRFKNIVGYTVAPSATTRAQLITLGLEPDSCGCTFRSIRPWVVARSSRLFLSSVGVYRQDPPESMQTNTKPSEVDH